MNIETKKFYPELGVIQASSFSDIYPEVNNYMLKNLSLEDSRDGKVRELLDVKTQILNPYKRCTGGCDRDINIFFLLAEAIWIALGHKDVKFLSSFNKKMIDFSDNGVNFHAPYGHRLRHWGIRSEDLFLDENLNAPKGYDQIVDAIKIFSENKNSRQIVLSIWNPNFDLGAKSKDIPCNDVIMLKIRKNKLITTIQNRSNDLHWGLPTNIFQFSFLTELIASSLGIELGTQTHNSQSLHIYEWNNISTRMNERYLSDNEFKYLYDYAKFVKMDFNFSHELPVNRFREIEIHLQILINNLTNIINGSLSNEDELKSLFNFSKYLYVIYSLLEIYIKYKQAINFLGCFSDENDEIRYLVLDKINELEKRMNLSKDWDILILANNFFVNRIQNKTKLSELTFLGRL